MTDKKLTDSEIVKVFEKCTLKAEHPGFILCAQIVDLINRLQAEVKHGEWIWKDVNGDGFQTLCCSECLNTEGARKTAKFCSECGAKMNN
jgi:hypothetical protein